MGCGWLGLPLAESFRKNGYVVKGTTTSPGKIDVLKKKGITPFLISLEQDKIVGDVDRFLTDLDILIINIPPRVSKSSKQSYLTKMRLLHSAIVFSEVSNIIFVSSISVYGNVHRKVTENSNPRPQSASGKAVLAAEQLFYKKRKLHTTVVRLGGLIGPNRHPIHSLSGKTDLINGNEHVNLIHLDDCIQAIMTIVEKNYWGEIFNAVYPDHPLKKDYYVAQARKRDLKIPQYVSKEEEKKGKIVICKNFLNKKEDVFTTTIF